MAFRPETIWRLSSTLHRRGWCRLARLLKAMNFILFRAVLPPEAVIGRDVRLHHFALCTVIHPNTTLGDRVRIFHGVTIAAEAVVGSSCRVVIGDDVVIGAGAVIVARIGRSLSIGRGAQIGANAVVTRDVEAGEHVGGVPARSLKGAAPDNSETAA